MKVLILMDQDGGFDVVTDGPAEVICVCEHAPNDRLYKLTDAHTVSSERVAEIIGDGRIGSSSDERHKALSNMITSAIDGKKPFTIVE